MSSIIGKVLGVVVLLLLCFGLVMDSLGQDTGMSVRADLAGVEYFGQFYFKESKDPLDEELYHFSNLERGSTVCPFDRSQSALFSIGIYNDGDTPIQICTDTHHFWDFLTIKAARLVKIEDPDVGPDEVVFCVNDQSGRTEEAIYKVQEVPDSTFTYEIAFKALVGDAAEPCVSYLENGSEITIPDQVFSLGKDQDVEIGYFAHPANPALEEGAYLFRVVVDFDQMSLVLPDLSTLLQENRENVEKWDYKELHLFKALDERNKVNSFFSVFCAFPQGETSRNWLETITAVSNYANRALLWYALGLSCLYSGDYAEANPYFVQCYSIIESGQDELLTEQAMSRFECAREAAKACKANEDYDSALNWCNVALEVLKHPDIIDNLTVKDESHVMKLEGQINSIIRSVREKMK